MTKPRHIFLYLFVAISSFFAVQYFILAVEDLESISAVEEQQETFSIDVEVEAIDFESPYFALFTKYPGEAFQEKHNIIHIYKNYPPIHLAVPYSPPELI
jgi:hypothetical protein